MNEKIVDNILELRDFFILINNQEKLKLFEKWLNSQTSYKIKFFNCNMAFLTKLREQAKKYHESYEAIYEELYLFLKKNDREKLKIFLEHYSDIRKFFDNAKLINILKTGYSDFTKTLSSLPEEKTNVKRPRLERTRSYLDIREYQRGKM